MNKEVTYTTEAIDQSVKVEKCHNIMDMYDSLAGEYDSLAREYADLKGEYLRLEKSCNTGTYINNPYELDKSGESTIPSQTDLV